MKEDKKPFCAIPVIVTEEDIQKYPNDADLGKYVRKLYLKTTHNGSNI